MIQMGAGRSVQCQKVKKYEDNHGESLQNEGYVIGFLIRKGESKADGRDLEDDHSPDA